jgi:hypothetical protein
MTYLVERASHLRTAFIAIVIALMLPAATLAYSPDHKDDRRNDSRRNNHSQAHRALESEHRGYHQYNRIDDREDRENHRKFHRYLESKHSREHRSLRNDDSRRSDRNRR